MKPLILDIGGSHNPKPDATHIIDIDPVIRSSKRYKVETQDLNYLMPLPYAENVFDKVYCDNVIEHLRIEPERLFKEVYRILNHKAEFVIECPNSVSYYLRLTYLFGIIPQDWHKEHIKHYTHEYIYIALINSGFKIKAISNIWRFIPVIKNCFGCIKFVVRKA